VAVAVAVVILIHLWPGNRVVCDSVCHQIVGGIPAYWDANHLSGHFTRSFGSSFLAEQLDELSLPVSAGWTPEISG